MRPIFESWLAPFRDLGVTPISIRNTGGTDHLSFAAVGLPGFQFIQDPLDYGTITHHSDMDTWDHAVPRGSDASLRRDRDRGLPDGNAQGDAAEARVAEGRVMGFDPSARHFCATAVSSASISAALVTTMTNTCAAVFHYSRNVALRKHGLPQPAASLLLVQLSQVRTAGLRLTLKS